MFFFGLFLIQFTAWPQLQGGAGLGECVMGAIDTSIVKDFGS